MGSLITSFRSRKRNKVAKVIAYLKPRPPPFRLLDLPPEIRDRIFAYTLSSPTGYVCFAAEYGETTQLTLRIYHRAPPPDIFNTVPYVDPRRFLGLPLLQACSLVYREARHHVYAQNTFILSEKQLVSLDNAHLRSRIQHIWVPSAFGPSFTMNICPLKCVTTMEYAMQVLCLLAFNKALGRAVGLKSVTLSLAHDNLALATMAAMHSRSSQEFGQICDIWTSNRKMWEAIDADDDGGGTWMDANKRSALIMGSMAAINSSPETPQTTDLYNLYCRSMATKVRKVDRAKVTRRLEILGNYGQHLDLAYAPAITQLRDAFGGELWFDNGAAEGGILCAVDGRETYELFY